MMKKISQLLIVLGIIAFNDVRGQEEHIDNYFMKLDVALKYGNYPPDAEGSLFINEEFKSAMISHNGKTYATRYNAVQDEIEIKFKNEIYNLPKTLGIKVTFKADQKVYQSFPLTKDANKNGFFVVVSEGKKATLLLKEHIKFVDKVEPSTGYDSAKPAQFKRLKDTYHLSFDKKSTLSLPSKKKEFLKLFGDQSKDVENYLKKEKLSIKKSKDLKVLFEFINSL